MMGRLIATLLLAAFSGSAHAADHPAAVEAALEEARNICKQSDGKPTVRAGAVQNFFAGRVWIIDLDPEKFDCDGATSLFCGTGGCSFQVFVRRGRDYKSVYDAPVRRWRLQKVNGKDVIAIDVHGSECGRAGAERCRRTIALD